MVSNFNLYGHDGIERNKNIFSLVLYTLLTICPKDLLKPQIVCSIMLGLGQQAVESIDRTRGLAGNLFCKIIHQ